MRGVMQMFGGKTNQSRGQRGSTWALALAAFVLVLYAASARSQTSTPPPPPPTRTDNVKEVLHGVEIGDPYRWLEDQNAPETRAWIDAQNTYMQSLLSKLPGRKELKQKLTALLKIES